MVGRPLRALPGLAAASLAAEAALAADEGAAPRGNHRFAGSRVNSHVLDHDKRTGALVVDAADRRDRAYRPGHRQRPVQLERLLGVHELRAVVITQAPAGCRPGDQHGEGRQHLLGDAL